MSETTNYGLYLTDDSSENFLDWRRKMNGAENSNMTKIDAALNGKANNSVSVDTFLLSSSWVGEEAPFTQELVVDGLLATTNGAINLSHSATIEQREAARMAMLSVVGQEEGKLIIAADGETPEMDIPVCVILLD